MSDPWIKPPSTQEDTYEQLNELVNTTYNSVKRIKDSSLPFFSQEFTASQTGLAIITPTAGKRLIITDLCVKTEATSNEMTLEFVSSGILVDKEYFSAFSSGTPSGFHDKIIRGAVDEVLSFTSSTAAKMLFLSIQYYEE